MTEVFPQSVIVSRKGGAVDFVIDGEIVASVDLPPGMVPAKHVLDLAPYGAVVQLSGDAVALHPRGGYGVQPYGDGATDTGANPDFRPTSASQMEREMRVTLAKVQQATARLEARQRALEKIERIPKGPGETAQAGGDAAKPAAVDPAADKGAGVVE